MADRSRGGRGLVPDLARARQFPEGRPSAEATRRLAQAAFEQATIVIDAEVLSPMRIGGVPRRGREPTACLRVIRNWKGRVAEGRVVRLVHLSSCDVALQTKGQNFRLLLMGDGVFRAGMAMNGAAADQAVFNREIDRLAGQPRIGDIAVFPGEGELPPGGRDKSR